jgi:hypothetical protein
MPALFPLLYQVPSLAKACTYYSSTVLDGDFASVAGGDHPEPKADLRVPQAVFAKSGRRPEDWQWSNSESFYKFHFLLWSLPSLHISRAVRGK